MKNIENVYAKTANEVITTLKQTAKGRVKVQVVENGKVVVDRPWQDNLILNQGMENLGLSVFTATTQKTAWCELFLHCAAGVGTRNTSVSSGLTTGSYSGGVFTISGGSYDFTDGLIGVGSLILMTSGVNSGVVMRITGVTDATHVAVVFESGSAAATGSFNVYYAQQVGLESESARQSSYLTGSGNCGSSFASNILTHKRTFDFSSPVSTLNYSELGFAHTSAAGNNLSMRIKLASPVTVTSAQQLRVIYQLVVTITPATLTPKTANITGWPVSPAVNTDGNEQWQLPGLSVVSTSGVTGQFETRSGTIMEPSATGSIGNGSCHIWLSSVSTAPVASFTTTPPDRTNGAITTQSKAAALSVYTAFSFTRDKTATFLVGDGNILATGITTGGIRSIGIGLDDGSNNIKAYNTGQTFAFVFANSQSKDSLHTLTLTFRFTWARTLA